MVVLDLLMLGVLLNVFAYFHHVRLDPVVPEPIVSGAAVPAAAATPEPTAVPAPAQGSGEDGEPADSTPEPEPEDEYAFFDRNGLLQGKYAERFSAEVLEGENFYRSRDISIEITEQDDYNCNVHVADILVNDIDCFRTAVYSEFDTHYMDTEAMAERAGAILAASGDFFYGHRQNGVFAVRNGLDYGHNPNKRQETCVLYRDGTMEVYAGGSYSVQDIFNRNPWHAWYFGPGLLDENGKAKTKFSSSVANVNPRSAIGYYEPGHYCFVMVEGRFKDSPGVTLAQLAEIFENLGCRAAYNLDGGQTADMVFGGSSICQIRGSARNVSDILYIRETEGTT